MACRAVARSAVESEGWGGRRDSNPQQQAPQAWTLPLSYDHQPVWEVKFLSVARQVWDVAVRPGRGIGDCRPLEPGRLIAIGLDHADDATQLHLAERAPPFAVFVPKGQTSVMVTLHQYQFAHRWKVVFIFPGRRRRRIYHRPKHPPADCARLAGFCQTFNDPWHRRFRRTSI